jgi:hypothetical protein
MVDRGELGLQHMNWEKKKGSKSTGCPSVGDQLVSYVTLFLFLERVLLFYVISIM